MAFEVQAEAPPLREDESGALRVGTSRVLLEVVICAFQDGATPEAIVQRYESLSLSDVYSIVAYYLRHPQEIDTYLRRRDEEGNAAENWSKDQNRDLSAIRARLSARRQLPG